MSLFSRRVDKQLEAYQRELVDTHYKEVENMYRQIRGWRHDYRNHIQVLKAFAAKGDMDAIRAYLDELDTDLNTVDTVVKTGNAMADAILNSKISLAKSRGITVQADAHIPVKLKMSELDLCCILGNLFDNAIEASMALPEKDRLIRVYMDMKGTQLYISFTNFTAGKKLEKTGGRFRTTKGEGHGFGLVRIDDIVARLDGYLSRNSEDGAFTTEIQTGAEYALDAAAGARRAPGRCAGHYGHPGARHGGRGRFRPSARAGDRPLRGGGRFALPPSHDDRRAYWGAARVLGGQRLSASWAAVLAGGCASCDHPQNPL